MSRQKKIIAAGLCLWFLFLATGTIYAAEAPTAVVELENPIGTKEPGKEFILQKTGTVIKGFLGVSGSIALVMFVYGGINWLLSGGNPDKIKKGKDIFVWAVIGLVIIFSSYFVVDLVIRALTAKTG